jgi:hypothetical protein
MEKARQAAAGDALDRLTAQAVAYADFLHSRPGLTRMMFATHPSRWRPAGPEPGPDPLERLHGAWTGAAAEWLGSAPQRDPVTEGETIWSAVHGRVTLTLVSLREQRRETLLASVRDYVEGLGRPC